MFTRCGWKLVLILIRIKSWLFRWYSWLLNVICVVRLKMFGVARQEDRIALKLSSPIANNCDVFAWFFQTRWAPSFISRESRLHWNSRGRLSIKIPTIKTYGCIVTSYFEMIALRWLSCRIFKSRRSLSKNEFTKCVIILSYLY